MAVVLTLVGVGVEVAAPPAPLEAVGVGVGVDTPLPVPALVGVGVGLIAPVGVGVGVGVGAAKIVMVAEFLDTIRSVASLTPAERVPDPNSTLADPAALARNFKVTRVPFPSGRSAGRAPSVIVAEPVLLSIFVGTSTVGRYTSRGVRLCRESLSESKVI